MSHELLPPTTTNNLITHACSCGSWHRVSHKDYAQSLQEIESDHTDHAHHAGAEELRTGKIPTVKFPHSALEDVIRAMAKVAEASVKATEAIQEFIDAHKAAKDRGIGVVVVRQADGSMTSTPNVFVPAGTAIFVDAPSVNPPLPPFTFTREDWVQETYPNLYPAEENVA